MVVVKEKVRKEIVRVSRRIFTRRGYRKTTMEEISEATKMGKSSIYYYFRNKEDIFRAVVTYEAKQLKNKLDKIIQKEENPSDRLRAYILFRLHHVRTLSNFYAALNDESLSHINFIPRIRKGFEKEEQYMVRSILEEGMAAGEFKIKSSEIGAVAISAMLKGLELPLLLNESFKDDREQLMDDLIRVLFYGIAKQE